MKRSDRLDKIVALNAGFESIASRSLAQARTRLDKQNAQLDRLVHYLGEYRKGLDEVLAGSASSREVQHYRAFILSLEKAIEQQEAMVQRCQEEMESARGAWLDKRQEVRKVEKAADKLRDRERLRREKHELHESDERNQYGGAAKRSPLA